MPLPVPDSRFGVWAYCLGFWVLGFIVSCFWSLIKDGRACRCLCLVCVSGFRFRILGFEFWGSSFPGSEFWSRVYSRNFLVYGFWLTVSGGERASGLWRLVKGFCVSRFWLRV